MTTCYSYGGFVREAVSTGIIYRFLEEYLDPTEKRRDLIAEGMTYYGF
jgi:hypothetical protein